MCNKIGGPRILQFSFFEILIQNSELSNLGVANEDLRSKMKSIFVMHYSMVSIIRPSPNVSTTPLRQWGFWQCLPFSGQH